MFRLPRDLNVDRLHNVLGRLGSDTSRPPHQGTTTAYMYAMMGEVWVGKVNGTYLYVTDSYPMLLEVKQEFMELIRQELFHEFVVESAHNATSFSTLDGQRYKFMTTDHVYRRALCGWRFDKIFFDVNDKSLDQLRKQRQLQLVWSEMQRALPPRDNQEGGIL